MSTATVEDLGEITTPRRFWDRQRRLGAALVLLGIVATVAFGAVAAFETARFTLSENAEGAALSVNGQFGAILFGLVIHGFDVPGQEATDVVTTLEAVPGALLGYGFFYWLGLRREAAGADDELLAT